jgi:16S rRNA (adenine1518-N6/adenine1519-N6)-dimethyltransferase
MYTLKKSLGQHFLRDENISRKIVQSVVEAHEKLTDGAKPWNLLEVGPGAGALTKYLLEIPDVQFRAVELDEEKVQYLGATWPVLKDKIIHKSILDVERPFETRFAVVGNFPYNISTQILFRMLEWKDGLETITGMFQKEVALRVAAKEGNKVYGVISVLIQAWFDVEYLFEVHEQCFNPPPKVKSAVIRLTPRKTLPDFRDEASFFQLVKAGFNQRRKTLRNAVRGLYEPAALGDPIFGKRAEQLTIDDFAKLTWTMRPVTKKPKMDIE